MDIPRGSPSARYVPFLGATHTGATGEATATSTMCDASADPDAPGKVLLSLRQAKPGGPFTAREQELAGAARKVYRSFHFGTGRD